METLEECSTEATNAIPDSFQQEETEMLMPDSPKELNKSSGVALLEERVNLYAKEIGELSYRNNQLAVQK